MKRALLQFFIFLFFSSCYAQEYSFTHYDVADGLAGSVVYCITQDKDGFIWTGTETGVSRFDGTHFKTFTVSDGLPDIEVLEMFGDSRGRVWMAPFKKSVCFYYRGVIHNQDNDFLLGRIRLRENVENFAEDATGNILILEKTALHWFGVDGTIREIDSLGGHPIRDAVSICTSSSGRFLVISDGQLYEFDGNHTRSVLALPFLSEPASVYTYMNQTGVFWRADSAAIFYHSFENGKTLRLPFDWRYYKHLSFTGIGDSLVYYNETTGAKELNINTGKTKVYLPGRAVSRTFRDGTGNFWFTTLGQGIYRLNSDEFRTIGIRPPGLPESSVHAVRRIGNRLLVGDDHNAMHVYSLPDMILQNKDRPIEGRSRKNRILYLHQLAGDKLLVCTDTYVGYARSWRDTIDRTVSVGIKAVLHKDKNEYIVGSIWGVGIFDAGAFRFTDTVWRERCTAVYFRRDTFYIGTLNGLYKIGPDRSPVYMGKDFPFLRKRISGLGETPDGTLWIASYDAGIVGWKDGRLVTRIDMQRGLTSNICRALLIQDSVLWIGTNKGLNRVDLAKGGRSVTHYTSNDGLGSDIVNCIYADGSTIYVGTTAGLSYFDQTKVDISEGCRLHLLSIFNAGTDRIGDSANLLIPYHDKHVRLEFAAISYRSVGDIVYRYRMLGLDTAWQTTKESFLEYPVLPSGQYVFQLQAINKFGIKSSLLTMPVEVATPFWQTAWFSALIFALFLLLVGLLVNLRIKWIRRRQDEKEQINHRLAELENMALQSQMNPHFIFNCLNSIQQYIFDHEALTANRYLTGFARLIRATLHNSSRNFISLRDEIDYLSTYLSLEKLRFREKMDFTIEVDPSIDKELFNIPPMLIQPFVENSMRHGLRHKTDGKGFIRVLFRNSDDRLKVTVEDNGIGRKKAAAYKTREHIEYQSKGMSLTADRIRMMNVKYGNCIHINVTDLTDAQGQAAGTRIEMEFPIFHLATEKDTIWSEQS